MQRTKVLAWIAALAVLSLAVTAQAPPPCTPEQLQTTQQVINQKLVETKCPELVMVDGYPDYKNTAFCSNDACVAALKKTKKALPKCSYDGASVRKGANKLLKACAKVEGNGSGGDDEDGSGSAPDTSATPTTTKTPKPSKVPKTKTPAPTSSQEIGKVIGADVGSGVGSGVGAPIATPPERPTDAPTTTAPSALTVTTKAPTVSTKTSVATSSGVMSVTTFVAVASTVIGTWFA